MKTLLRIAATLGFTGVVVCLFAAIWLGDVRFLWTATLLLLLSTIAATQAMTPPSHGDDR